MANVYDALVHFKSLEEVVTKHNRLVNSLGKDLSTVVTGGGVGDVKSPIIPGVIDDTVVLYDGISGKRIKSSEIYASWFDQDVSTTAHVDFNTVTAKAVYLNAEADYNYLAFVVDYLDGDYSLDTYITPDGIYEEKAFNFTTYGYIVSRSIDLDTGDTTFQNVITKSETTNYVDFIEQTEDPPDYEAEEGRLLWNKEDGTLEIGLKGGNVTLQIGQEHVAYVRNHTGGTLLEGKVVGLVGSSGDRALVDYAIADGSISSRYIIGVLTEDIEDEKEGFVTTYGFVRNLNTSAWVVGTILYADPITPGNLTATVPTPPHLRVPMAIVTRQHATVGMILVRPYLGSMLSQLHDVYVDTIAMGNGLFWNDDNSRWEVETIAFDTQEPTGFVDRDAVLSFVDGTRTFTITGNHDIYYNGVKHTMPTASIPIADTTGLHHIYYNSDLELEESLVFPGVDALFVAYVYWNTTIDKGILSDERHGIVMDYTTHDYLHHTVGARYESGLAGTFADASFAIGTGEIWDEDIKHTIPPSTSCLVMYKNGASTYEWDVSTDVYYKLVSGSLQYNDGDTLTPVDANKYVAAFIFGTNNVDYPIIAVIGQRQDTLIADARANNTFSSISFADLPFPEYKILYRVILRNDATPYEETQDLRTIGDIGSGSHVATDHGSLTGLSDLDHPASAIINTPAGNIIATNVQAAINELDGKIGTPLGGTKTYYVADSSGGATTRKLTFINGILTSET